jgi:hypothetical protein
MSASDRKVVLVTRRTRLQELISQFHTVDQARFYVEHLATKGGPPALPGRQ